ncbi:MAG: 6-carboxytetrahydropterin synthase [Planctomycetota bacterium]
MLLTRRFTFSASHRLVSTALDGPGNERIYGACQRVHGHNFRLEVTVSGTVDPTTGFFCNVLELEHLVRSLVVAPCDHQMLNEMTMFAGTVPTMEVVAQTFWRLLTPALTQRGMTLVEILFAETDDHWVRVRDG